MIKIISYFLLLEARRISVKFSFPMITKKSFYITYLSGFITILISLILLFNLIFKTLFDNNVSIDQHSLLVKSMYILILLYLSFNNIGSTYNKVYKGKDRGFIMQSGNYSKKLIASKYIASAFPGYISLSSIIFISVNISLLLLLKDKHFAKYLLHSFLQFIIVIALPIIFRFILINYIYILEKKFSYYVRLFFKISVTFGISFILSYEIINWNSISRVNILKYLEHSMALPAAAIVYILAVAASTVLLMVLQRLHTTGRLHEKKTNMNSHIFARKLTVFKDRFIYYQMLMFNRENSALQILIESISTFTFMLLGVLLNMDKTLLDKTLCSILFFNLIFASELSEAIVKRILMIENDKFLVRHLMNTDSMEKFLNTKIKVYFIIFAMMNIILMIPGLIFGGIAYGIGIAVAITLSLIYSFSTVMSNILRPNFGCSKNEELDGTLANDIFGFALKMVNIFIYYICCISLFALVFTGKIGPMAFWGMLLGIMWVHAGILFIFYRRMLFSRLWENWEGV